MKNNIESKRKLSVFMPDLRLLSQIQRKREA